MRKYNMATLLGVSLMAATGAAMATPPAGVDVSGAVSAIGDMATPIGALGLASLLIVVAIKTWKYLRRGV